MLFKDSKLKGTGGKAPIFVSKLSSQKHSDIDRGQFFFIEADLFIKFRLVE